MPQYTDPDTGLVSQNNTPPLQKQKLTGFFIAYVITAGAEAFLYLGFGGVVISVSFCAAFIGLPLFCLGLLVKAWEMRELNKKIIQTQEILIEASKQYLLAECENFKKLNAILQGAKSLNANDFELAKEYFRQIKSRTALYSEEALKHKAEGTPDSIDDLSTSITQRLEELKPIGYCEVKKSNPHISLRPPPPKKNWPGTLFSYLINWVYGIITVMTVLYLLAQVALVAAFLATMLAPPLLPLTLTCVVLLGASLAFGYLKLCNKHTAIHKQLDSSTAQIEKLNGHREAATNCYNTLSRFKPSIVQDEKTSSPYSHVSPTQSPSPGQTNTSPSLSFFPLDAKSRQAPVKKTGGLFDRKRTQSLPDIRKMEQHRSEFTDLRKSAR